MWVLQNWLEAVDFKQPTSIITDQNIALGNAIAQVLPKTKHMYCTWHISQNFPEMLSSLYSIYGTEFKRDFNCCVYKSLTGDEFETKWENLVNNYDLEDHIWLHDMYLIRHKWIRAYTKLHFSAGMTTTSRSESMNSFFDEYVNATTGLKEFIENSQKALKRQYLRENEADYETIYKNRTLITFSFLEQHVASLYTKEMFRRFQHELQQSGAFVLHQLTEFPIDMGTAYVAFKSTVPKEFRRVFTIVISNYGNVVCVCK